MSGSAAELLHHNPGSSYFSTADGRAVFLEGDNEWNDNISFGQTGQFDFGAYLNFLTAEGGNLVRYWAQDGLYDPVDHLGPALIMPFNTDASGKFDLTSYNQAYFDHVKADVSAAAAKGVYLQYMLFFDYDPQGEYGWSSSPWNGANNVNGTVSGGNGSNAEASDPVTLKLQEAYIAKLLDTVGSAPNVLWEVANEPNNSPATIAWENTIVDFIHAYQASHGLPAQPVGITASYWEGDTSAINSAIAATDADWTSPFGGTQYQSNPPDATGAMVSIPDTDHTFGIGGNGDWVWEQFTRGQGGVSIMDDLRGSGLPGLTDEGPSLQAGEQTERTALDGISRVTQMVDISTMVANNALSSTGYALADASRGEYVVLAPGSGNVTLDLSGSAGRQLSAVWLDVADNTLSAATSFAGGNPATVLTPAFADAVLIVQPAATGAVTPPAPPPVPVPGTLTVGSGPDTLALAVSEDAWQGNAAFTVSVDGQQVGGTLTATAAHAAGQSQTVDILGSYAGGNHAVSVDFLNDAYAGTSDTDRNLYVTSAAIDGTAVPGATLTLLSAGSQGFSFTGTAGASAVVGSGSSVLSLGISEDAFQGDAQFTLSVDGKQVGGTLTSTASHGAGASQVFDILGDFAAGPHTVGIDFLNDAYEAAIGDRNLYVTSANLSGASVSGTPLYLLHGGTQSFAFTVPGPAN